MDTKSYGGGIRVLAPYLVVWWYVGIYIGGRSTSVEERGAHEGGGRAQGGRRAPLPRAFLVAFLT